MSLLNRLRSNTTRFTSTVKLYVVPEIGNGRMPAFTSLANQTAFFEERKVQEIPDCKILRIDGIMKVNLDDSEIAPDVNYLSFINPNYENKTYYCVVNGHTYTNDQCTLLSYSVDPIQTRMFDVTCIGHETSIGREMLSQRDKAIVEDNPYDLDVWQMDTPEPLNVSQELQHIGYEFKSHTAVSDTAINEDALFLFPMLSDLHTPGGGMLTLMFISHIDWDKLDAIAQAEGVTPLPSTKYNAIKTACEQYQYTFYISNTGSVHLGTAYGISGTARTLSDFDPQCDIFALEPGVLTQDGSVAMLDLLTRYNQLSAIINMYNIPRGLFLTAFTSASTDALPIVRVTPKGFSMNVHSDKLKRFPFSYLRLIDPNGNRKELRYEWFKNLNTHTYSNIDILVGTDLVNGFNLIAAPSNYKNFYNIGTDSKLDTDELMMFGTVPTAAYTTDAFLTQMAATASELRRSATDTLNMQYSKQASAYGVYNNPIYTTMEGLGATINAGTQLAGGVSSSTGEQPGNPYQGAAAQNMSVNTGKSVANMAMQIPSAATGVMAAAVAQGQRAADESILYHQAEVIRSARNYLAGGEGDAFLKEYSTSRATYATDNYHRPVGAGFEYLGLYGWLNIALQQVYLKDSVLSLYDQFFKSYGYTSGRTGVPYILEWINGESDTTKIPEWIDGETYIKTDSIHFTGAPRVECETWEALFNSGIHWLNGDALITPQT